MGDVRGLREQQLRELIGGQRTLDIESLQFVARLSSQELGLFLRFHSLRNHGTNQSLLVEDHIHGQRPAAAGGSEQYRGEETPRPEPRCQGYIEHDLVDDSVRVVL
jgi:hypothetical protein